MPRPKLTVQEVQVKQWALAQCSLEEIAACTGISKRVLALKYKARIAKWNSQGQKEIKLQQFAMAISGNVQMLIWLGKQHLGQAEKLESKMNGKKEGKRLNIILEPPRKKQTQATPPQLSLMPDEEEAVGES